MAAPTLAAVLLSPPFFLHRLQAGWAEPEVQPEVRLANSTKAAFTSDVKPYSLWRVETESDFRRAMMAMYAGRERLGGNIRVLPISQAELDGTGVPAGRSPGKTRCVLANATLHFDWPAESEHAIELCGRLLAAGRLAVTLRENDLLLWHAESLKEGCLISKTLDPCRVPECLNLPALPAAPAGA